MMRITKQRPDVAVIVLTRNAGQLWSRWIRCIQQQSVQAGRYLVVDSSSTDDTVDQALAAGLEVYSIPASDFDHGGTRQLAATLCPDAKYLVYLTQDALLEQPDSLEHLMAGFADEDVAMVYGRHQPHPDAGLIEQHARLFTYPDQSAVRSQKDFERLGFRAAFSSDVYAAYRADALHGVGGFPAHMIVSEDSYLSARLLMAGWKTMYCAQSRVLHSHDYSLVQVFRRYFDVGVFHSKEQALLSSVGCPDREAWVYVRSLIQHLKARNRYLLPLAAVQTFVKLLGFRLGRRYQKLPAPLCRVISLQKAYWNCRKRRLGSVQWVYGRRTGKSPSVRVAPMKKPKVLGALSEVKVGDTAS